MEKFDLITTYMLLKITNLLISIIKHEFHRQLTNINYYHPIYHGYLQVSESLFF